MLKTPLKAFLSCCMQKTALKNISYSKNGNFSIMTKIGHNAKAIALATLQLFHHGQNWPQCKGYSLCKIVILGQNLKFSETC